MPILTDERRQARRDQISNAALHCFSVRGVERTSIAEITQQSGLSAGSIYVHYENKAAVAREVAVRVLEMRTEQVRALVRLDSPPSPAELIVLLVRSAEPREASTAVQFWGVAVVDEDIRAVVLQMTHAMNALIEECCAAWFEKAEHCQPDTALERAKALAPIVTATCQGLLMHDAVLGDVDTAGAELFLSGLMRSAGHGQDGVTAA